MNIFNKTPRYLFKIISSKPDLILNTPPIGWDDGIYEYDRDILKGGITQTFNAASLIFIKEGGQLLREIMDDEEVNGEAKLEVYRFKTSTLTYEKFPTVYDFSFDKAKKTKIGRSQIGIEIQVKKSGIQQKIEKRGSTDVDVTKTVSIGGYNIVDYGVAPYQDLKNLIKFPVIYAYALANYNNINNTQLFGADRKSLTIDNIIDSDFDETQTQINPDDISASAGFFNNSSTARSLEITGTTGVTYTWISQDVTDVFAICKAVIYNESNVEVSEVFLGNVLLTEGSTSKSITINGTIDLQIGYSSTIIIQLGLYPIGITNVNQSTTTINIKEKLIQTAETTTYCLPVYEVAERCTQLITDSQFPFYSETLGRTDVIYNSAGDKYLSEDQLAFRVYTTGLALRGDILTNPNNPLAVNYDDLFQTLQTQMNLGQGLETIEGETRVRWEEYSYFFKDDVVLDLSGRISILDIESEFTNSIIYLNVESGNENYDYESVNGRGEYNTENKRTLPLNSENTFNNKAVYREDTRGITKQLELAQDDLDTTDEKEDNDVFSIKVQKNPNKVDEGLNAVYTGGAGLITAATLDNYTTIDLSTLDSSDFTETQTVIGGLTDTKANSFFLESSVARILKLTGNIPLNASIGGTGSATVQIEAHIYNSTGIKIIDFFLGSATIAKGQTTATIQFEKFIQVPNACSVTYVISFTERTEASNSISWDSSSFSILEGSETVNDWGAETDENITILNNTSLFQEGSLNLIDSPVRKLVRSSTRWTAGMLKNISGYLRFQTAGKLQTLETSGEGYEITENEDVQIGESFVNLSLFRPIKHTFEVKITWDDIEAIQANPYGVIKINENLSGWILNLQKKNNQDKALITIIEKR